jgi:DNA-binding NtrC family response regulator
MDPIDQQLEQKIAEALSDRGPGPRNGPGRILLVAPAGDVRTSMQSILETRRHNCMTIGRLDEARALLTRSRFDLVLINDQLPDGRGIELAPLIQKVAPTSTCILMASSSTFIDAVRAMRSGVVDFIAMHLDQDDFVARIDWALFKCRIEQERV